ncbi:hypothetical protein LUZ60_002464 [Juncus effusus]|nr:hypothetical protein LUZ60_002464 [Juncus effusus]
MAGGEDEEEERAEGGLDGLLRLAALIGISDSSSSSCSNSCLGNSLLVSHFPNAGGRGLGAARDLKRGEMILKAPKSALLTTQSVLSDPKIASFMQLHPYLSPPQRLIVCLLTEVEKGRRSKWYPYLSQLPKYYTTLSNFTETEVKSFQVEYAIWAAEKAINKTKSEWKQSLPLLKQLNLKSKLLNFKSWIWASQTVSSRTLHITWDEAGCLCPIGDLFNYEAPDEFKEEESEIAPELQGSNCGAKFDEFDLSNQRLTDGGFEESCNSYCFYARKRYKKGEQVLLSYGTYTNLELLEHYGFLLTENPNEKAFIQLDPELCKITIWPKDSLYIQQNGTPSFCLLCLLRLWATPFSERKNYMKFIHNGSQLNVQNELHVLNYLAKRCYEILKEFPSTIKEDNYLISRIDEFVNDGVILNFEEFGANLSEFREIFEENGVGFEKGEMKIRVRRAVERLRLAVEWRLGFKRILFKCVCYCKERIDELSLQK